MTDKSGFGRRDVLGMGGMLALGAGLVGRSAAASAAEGGALKPAHIVNTAGNATLVLQELLNQQGYLKEFGLDAATINVGDGSKLMGSLFSGSEDICILSGFSQVFPAVERGGKLKVLGGAGLLAEQTVYTKRPEIKSLKDLVGRSVGTGSPGALLHQLMIALFEKKGIDYSKVTFVNVGSSADVFRAVVAGTVDAGPGQIDVFDQQDKYGVHSLTDANMWDEIPEYTYQGAFATDDAIANKRDVLVRVLAAYAKLYRYLLGPNSKDAFIKARLAVLKGADPEQIRHEGEFQWGFFQKHQTYAVNLVLSEQRIQYMQDLNLKLGIQKKLLPFNQVADMSLARDALKLLG